MVWRQEQRAIGEMIIDRSSDPVQCIGYASFVAKLDDPHFSTWFQRVQADSATAIDDPSVRSLA